MSQHNYFLGNSGTLIKFDAHKTPEFKERNNVDWVIYGNDDDWRNRYPDYLIHLYNSSAKNNTIINEKTFYTVGQGLTYSGAGLSTIDKVEIKTFISKLSDNRVFERSAKDRIIQGGFANEIIYNKKGDKVVAHHIDFSYIRVSKPVWNESENRYEDPIYYYTSNWAARKPQNNPDFQEFHPFKFDDKPDKDKRYLVYYKDYRPNLGVYPLPEYLACVPYIAADYEISNFTYNNVKNGFSSGYLVNFYNGEPSEEQKRSIVTDFDDVLHGTDNAGKSIKSFNEDKDSGVEITPINPNGQDDRFLNLNNSIRDEIYTGHGVDPVIVGLKGDNGFNNNADEKRTAIEGWQNGYIDTVQGVFEEYFTSLLNFNGVPGEIEVLKKEPISVAPSENEIAQVLSMKERRERIGYTGNKPAEIVEEVITEMSKDSQLLDMFSNCGISDKELITISTRQVHLESAKDAFNKGLEFIESFATQIEISILKMLISGLGFEEIKKSLNLTQPQFDSAIINLTSDGLLNDDSEPTDAGVNEAEKNEVFVVYKYAKRSDASGGSIIPTTRDFCRDLVNQSRFKSWTIEDIELMNNGMGLDVFTSRGGWKTIEGTNRHTPFCRHIWEQRLVTRR